MKSIFAVIAFALLLVGIANATQVVFIGGVGGSPPDLVAVVQEKIPGSVVVDIMKTWPLPPSLPAAAADILQQLKEKEVDTRDGLILVGYSFGGLVARQLDADNPGLVKKVVTVASPAGGYLHIPKDVLKSIFKPNDGESHTPLYVIGGYDSRLPQTWRMKLFMQPGENDGVVALQSVFDIDRSVTDIKVFSELDHVGLMKSPDVLGKVLEWITPVDESSFALAGK